MEDLYDKLWNKNLPIIQSRKFTIQRPRHGFRPGYMVSLEATEYETFLDPEFALRKKRKSFKVLNIALDSKWNLKLPCGTSRLLVRTEFEAIEHELVEMAIKKWELVDSDTGIPRADIKLDYNLTGQPGSGVSHFNYFFSDYRSN